MSILIARLFCQANSYWALSHGDVGEKDFIMLGPSEVPKYVVYWLG